MTSSPESVLERIPGWQDASAEELDGGLMNRTFRVRVNGNVAVLKIDEEPQRPPRNPRSAEAGVQTAAWQAGLAARVLYHDETCFLTEYLDGTVWQSTDLDVECNLEKLGRALARLHALTPTGRRFDPVSAAHIYASSIEARPDEVRQCVSIVEETPAPDHYSFCHNDLVAANMIETPSLKFLDWEWACDNDPMFDLATVIYHHGLAGWQVETLLHAYAGEGWTALRHRLAEQARLYEALLWLWQTAWLQSESEFNVV